MTSQSEPWVCKLMDYKREKYNQMKKEKAKKRGQQLTKETHIKVRMVTSQLARRGSREPGSLMTMPCR